MPAAAHLVREWLPRSATFIHTALRHQRRYRPVVLADQVTNAREFPIDPVVELLPGDVPIARRLADRLAARRHGLRTSYDARIARAVRRHGCTVLHAHFGPMGCRALDAAAGLGLPLVTTFYGYDLAFARENPEWQEPYERLFRDGTLFVCEGPAMAAHLASLGCPRDRIRIVKIGIELERFPYDPHEAGSPFTFVATGRFVPKKGFDLAIRAFAGARAELGEGELWLIGDGPERAALEHLVGELGADAHVRFHGMVDYSAYADLMRRADAGLQPSRTAPDGDTEGGAPTVIIEMQAAGMPVVATRHADIPAVAAHADQLVAEEDVEALSNAMVAVARLSADERLQRARAARALVEREHDAGVTAKALEAVYDEAIGAT